MCISYVLMHVLDQFLVTDEELAKAPTGFETNEGY